MTFGPHTQPTHPIGRLHTLAAMAGVKRQTWAAANAVAWSRWATGYGVHADGRVDLFGPGDRPGGWRRRRGFWGAGIVESIDGGFLREPVTDLFDLDPASTATQQTVWE